ncbi:hypothetical protein [Microbacterium sp.]|nr:hypothetical protein [Microbacterium sp.]
MPLPAELAGREARWADGSIAESAPRGDGASVLTIPDALRSTPVAVATIS